MPKINKTNQVSADHYNAYNEARNLMKEMDIQSLPVDPFKLAEQLNIELITYAEADELFPERVIKLRNKKIDAVVIKPDYLNDEYFILYDNLRPNDRIRFTIAHEIGHIRIGHMNKQYTQFTRYAYNKMTDPIEQEAESFAGELLRPPLLLSLVNAEAPHLIQSICNISHTAAEVGSRKVTKLKQQSRKPLDPFVQFYSTQFHDFIYQKYCPKCKHYFISSTAQYCSKCGSTSLLWGHGHSSKYDSVEEKRHMIYDGYELDKNGKALVCPRCNNEEIHPDYPFCKICGTYLINKCAGKFSYDDDGEEYQVAESCNTVAEGNQRFCYKCGGITTYYKAKLLLPWEKKQSI